MFCKISTWKLHSLTQHILDRKSIGSVEHMEMHVLLNVHWLLHVAPCWGYNDSNLIVCVLPFISGRPLCLTLRPICLWFRTAAPAALSASASVPSSTASKWLPGQHPMCQWEASLKPSCLYAEWKKRKRQESEKERENKKKKESPHIYIRALISEHNCRVKNDLCCKGTGSK